MKRKNLVFLCLISPVLVVGCKRNKQPYEDKEVNIYRKKVNNENVVDKKMSLRFYQSTPNVPYVSVPAYYKEFFAQDLTLVKEGSQFLYFNEFNACIAFDTKNNAFASSELSTFSSNPNFKSSTGKVFIKSDGAEYTDIHTKSIDLNKYSIALYDDAFNAYAPLSFLSCLFGGLETYDIAYNGKDIYVMDMSGLLGEETNFKYYGSAYQKELNNVYKKRPDDVINYTYNELCFVFDNLRGYTKQLHFGDDNLVNLGLDALLTQQHPIIKQYLLSKNKDDYYEGLFALFVGLSDGGHTGLLNSFSAFSDAIKQKSEKEFSDLQSYYVSSNTDYSLQLASFQVCREQVLDVSVKDNFYYLYNSTYSTAFIGFNSFDVDYDGWNKYYNGQGGVPVSTDTYAFIRDSLYKAKSDGAENVVLDLTSNTGGNSYALEGIVGLLNGGKSVLNYVNTFNDYHIKEKHLIDINLDGNFDELDVVAANSLNFNYGVLTSRCAFSCGNLLPSALKDLGYKVIGEKSGGGSCAISIESTADGIPYVHSSYICFENSAHENVDGGVPVDFTLVKKDPTFYYYDCRDFYDVQKISNYLSSAYL